MDKRIHTALLKAFKPVVSSVHPPQRGMEELRVKDPSEPSQRSPSQVVSLIERKNQKKNQESLKTSEVKKRQEGIEAYQMISSQRRFKKKKKGHLVDFATEDGESERK